MTQAQAEYLDKSFAVERLARALERAWDQPSPWREALTNHARATHEELLAIEDFVAALYARMGDFAAFTEVARLYFCAVIYCETARRLGCPDRAGGYLMREHQVFGPAARAICAAARAQRFALPHVPREHA